MFNPAKYGITPRPPKRGGIIKSNESFIRYTASEKSGKESYALVLSEIDTMRISESLGKIVDLGCKVDEKGFAIYIYEHSGRYGSGYTVSPYNSKSEEKAQISITSLKDDIKKHIGEFRRAFVQVDRFTGESAYIVTVTRKELL